MRDTPSKFVFLQQAQALIAAGAAKGVELVIAGGAPRDIDLGVEVRDIDLYCSIDYYSNVYKSLTGRAPSDDDWGNKTSEEYEHQYIQSQSEFVVQDEIAKKYPALFMRHPVNLIALRDDDNVKAEIDGYEITSAFNLGLSKYWIDKSGLCRHEDAVKDATNRTITVLRDGWGKEGTLRCLDKLQRKYPSYKPVGRDGQPFDRLKFMQEDNLF